MASCTEGEGRQFAKNGQVGHDLPNPLISEQPWFRVVFGRATQAALGLILALALPVHAEVELADLAPPSDLRATYDEATAAVVLSWSAPSADAYVFHVYRGGKEIASTTATTLTDAGFNADGGALYYIRASLLDSAGQGAPSLPVYVTPNDNPPEQGGDGPDAIHYKFLGMGWCDVVSIGTHPQIDWFCVWSLIDP